MIALREEFEDGAKKLVLWLVTALYVLETEMLIVVLGRCCC